MKPNITTLKKPAMRQEMTEEQKMAQRVQIFMQKREQYALNAALKMLEGYDFTPDKEQIGAVVDAAVDFADKLLDKLYNEDEGKEDSGDKED